MKIYRVGVVSYLNSKPFLEGILHDPIIRQIHLQVLPPAEIAALLVSGELDIGLVPVKVMHSLSNPHIHTNYCIGSTDKVHSVCIFSNTPIEHCHTLLLDSESRTSVAFSKVLLRDYFKLTPALKPSYVGYESDLQDGVAGLVIGDRSFAWHKVYTYVYDLGYYWKKLTGLPFVYAAWLSNTPLESEFTIAFNRALENGLNRINDWLPPFQTLYPDISLNNYFTKHISYQLDQEKRNGLALFLEKSREF